MRIKKEKIKAEGIKFLIERGKKEIGGAFLYILRTDPEKKPYGLIGRVFIDEGYRRQGMGTKLIRKMLVEARRQKCYKVILTCRQSNLQVHRFYKKLGFKDWGKEFRIDYK